MICPYCGTENRNTAKFCDRCGYELPTVAPDAREIFGDEGFLVEGSDAITVDLQGLERMVDSSNSGVMYDDLNPYGSYTESIEDASSPTVPLSARTAVIGEVSNPGVSSGSAGYEDVYETKTIPGGADSAYRTAEFSAVGSSSASMLDNSAKTFSAAGDAPSGSNPKRKVIIAVVAVLIALCLAAAALITYNLQLWGGISVPDVVRQSESVAKQNLEAAGFSVDVEYVVSDDVQGIVVSTNPGSGARIAEGSLVVISVSIPRVIPEIIGLTQDEAASMLAESGYEDVEFTTQKSNEAQGSVISVDPGVGVEAVADTHVIVAVAEPFRVPAIDGLTRDEAIAALEAEGYSVKTVSYITEDIAEGMAVSTDPAAGTVLPSGSEVVLNVAHNRSTELIEATKAYLSGSTRFSINGINYEIGEIKSVTYQGSDSCAYSITARPYETHTWLFGDTETRYGNYETISGTITYNADNSIKSSDPAIKRL